VGSAVLLGWIYAPGRVEIKKWGLTHPHVASPPANERRIPSSPAPDGTTTEGGHKLAECLRVILTPYLSRSYALREIDGSTAVPPEAMLFTQSMLFTLIMKIGKKCYTFFLLCLYEIFFFSLKRYWVAEAGLLKLEAHSSLIT
jgi:hypothetical protein